MRHLAGRTRSSASRSAGWQRMPLRRASPNPGSSSGTPTPISTFASAFTASPNRLTELLFPQVCQWGQELMDAGLVSRYVFDTYEQELERFGGPGGMQASEAVFYADSRAAADLVKVLASKSWSVADDRTALLALTTDTLLAALGVDDEHRTEWYERQVERSGHDAGADYRRLKTGLRAALGSSRAWLAGKPFGVNDRASPGPARGRCRGYVQPAARPYCRGRPGSTAERPLVVIHSSPFESAGCGRERVVAARPAAPHTSRSGQSSGDTSG